MAWTPFNWKASVGTPSSGGPGRQNSRSKDSRRSLEDSIRPHPSEDSTSDGNANSGGLGRENSRSEGNWRTLVSSFSMNQSEGGTANSGRPGRHGSRSEDSWRTLVNGFSLNLSEDGTANSGGLGRQRSEDSWRTAVNSLWWHPSKDWTASSGGLGRQNSRSEDSRMAHEDLTRLHPFKVQGPGNEVSDSAGAKSREKWEGGVGLGFPSSRAGAVKELPARPAAQEARSPKACPQQTREIPFKEYLNTPCYPPHCRMRNPEGIKPSVQVCRISFQSMEIAEASSSTEERWTALILPGLRGEVPGFQRSTAASKKEPEGTSQWLPLRPSEFEERERGGKAALKSHPEQETNTSRDE
ncbi:uncharacterized protein LOC143834365 isoform X2 [Paroedura picta]|uniref:uncharacterized protein LOC143834365 isoform X2 n=1 Tax=Paroedura picta TaxID=143630 RepID=UPI004056D999